MRGAVYNVIDASTPYVLRGTNQQTDTGLLFSTPTFKTYQRGGTPTTVVAHTQGMALSAFALHNRSGGAVAAGIGVRIPNALWKAYSYVDATTTVTDDTADAQQTTTNDFTLETLTNNDGFVIASRVPFNAVSINVSTASVDGTPVRATRFSDAAGSAWQTADTNLFIPPTTGAVYATGEMVIAFAPPADWGKSSALATALPDGYYAMNVRSTTAPTTTAGLAKAIEIFRLYYLTENLGDNAILDKDWGGGEFPMAQDSVEGAYGDALVALFSTANDMNRVTASVRAL